VADGSAYYRAAGEVLRNGFKPGEQAEGMRLRFINALLAGIGSPSDAAAFAELLSSLQLRSPEWELLLGGAQLEVGVNCPRLSLLRVHLCLSAGVKQIESRAESFGLGTEGLRRSIQRFIVTQESAARCEENYNVSELSLTTKPANWVAFVDESYVELPGSFTL